jgi:hypothetical protein
VFSLNQRSGTIQLFSHLQGDSSQCCAEPLVAD